MTLWELKDNFSLTDTALSPSTYSSEKIIIGVSSANVPSSWVSAGWCRAVYSISEIGEVKGHWSKLALNEKQLLVFPGGITDYKILFELKVWISIVNITIWEGN